MHIRTLTGVAALALTSGAVLAQPTHIFFEQDNGRLVTSLWEDADPLVDSETREGGNVTFDVRSFSEQMGGIVGFGPLDPGQSIHPGFFGEIEGITVGVNLRAPLRVWDGSDFDEISGDDPGEQRMNLSGFTTPFGNNPLSPDTFVTPTSDVGITVLDEEWITAGDEIDEHIQYTLTDADGNILDASAADAVSAVFLVELEFTSTTLTGTEPIFIVLGQNVSDAELAAAKNFVDTVIIPAPGGIAAFAGVALFASRRRRA
ncbi:MAG: hypothetical protein AAGH64_09415 [Planctomycetota bacterium]